MDASASGVSSKIKICRLAYVTFWAHLVHKEMTLLKFWEMVAVDYISYWWLHLVETIVAWYEITSCGTLVFSFLNIWKDSRENLLWYTVHSLWRVNNAAIQVWSPYIFTNVIDFDFTSLCNGTVHHFQMYRSGKFWTRYEMESAVIANLIQAANDCKHKQILLFFFKTFSRVSFDGWRGG